MPTSTNVTNLKINELTEAQYDTAVQQGVIGANELSIITDAGGGDFVPQLDTLPTAGATNVGDIVQYSGTTIPDVDATATGTQTAGSGLTDITVNVATFEGVEQPTGAETVEFTASVTTDSSTYTTVTGSFILVGGNLRGVFENYGWTFGPEEHNGVIVFNNSQDCYIGPEVGTMWIGTNVGVLESYGFQFIGTPTNEDVVQYSYTDGSTTWTKDSETVDINAYGVSFSGTPSDGDEITVTYTPAEKGITNGYFYQSSASYSDPSATISQTTGSGLTGLAVNVDTFVSVEQPEGDESVVFTSVVNPDSMSLTTESGNITFSNSNPVAFKNAIIAWAGTFYPAYYAGNFVYNSGSLEWLWYNQDMSGLFSSFTSQQMEEMGFVITGTPEEGDKVSYIYTDGSTSWTKDNETVNPADYGVSYSGEPNNGDALTVVYTAPTVTGYAWEQKDVQPSSGSGSAGIDWKTSVDLPGNFQEGSWGVSPIFKINGGLPDGIYEFYYQIKTGGTFMTAADFIPAIVTFRYLIKVDNSSVSIKGMFAPVIDGEWIGNNGKRAPQEEESVWSFGWKDGNGNFYFWSDSNWWNTNIHGYANPCPDVSDCFRLSAIKNLTTGQEYIAEGSLYDNVQPPYQMASQMVIKAIQETQYVPNSTTYGDIDISMLGASQTLVCQGIRYESGQWVYSTELTVNMKCGADRFIARFQAFIDEYVLTIDEATGIFENTEFVKTLSSLYVKLNLPAGTTSGIIQSQYALKDMTMNMGAGFYNEDITGQSTTQLIPLRVGVAPSVANYLGKIVQYKGATDANYTNGYFYKATGNVVNVPGSVTCTETSGLGKTITLDVDGFLNYMMGLGYDRGTIENWLNNSFIFEYSVDANSFYWNCMGAFPDPTAALQFFTFSPAAASGEYIVWTTSNYVATHTDVQNAAWEEVQTQPGATTPSTMPTLLAANWSSSTQTVTVQGVTTSNNVIVAPAPASAADYASAGIVCTAQSTNSLTFTCTQTPSNDITVNVVIL